MKRSVFLLIAVITAFLLSGCRFVRIEEEERKPVFDLLPQSAQTGIRKAERLLLQQSAQKLIFS